MMAINHQAGKKIAFQYTADSAENVFLSGTFNNWDQKGNPLKKNSSGQWTTALKLVPGKYEYRFIVDGTWECDQQQVECVPNTFGSWNSVVTVI